MSDGSKIEWTEATWNPVTGCSKVSQGCKHCYAEREWPRLAAPRSKPNIYTGRDFTDVKCHPEKLEIPLRWTKPRRIFVNSMSDLFHEDVPDDFIDEVFTIMARASHHIFQVLTKRPERMRKWCQDHPLSVPLPNVWLGVSCEDQATADERIPLLLQTPAALRWVSAEPLLGPIDLWPWVNINLPSRWPRHIYAPRGPFINWIVVGGESGPDARPFRVSHARDIIRQCRAGGVPVFMKQMGSRVIDRNDAGFDGCDPGSWPLRADGCDTEVVHHVHGYSEEYQGADCRVLLVDRKGSDPTEWPEDLRVREYPA